MPLNIVLNFQSSLRRCVPCDAQTFFKLRRDTPLHHEAFALLLKEPWLVELFDSICTQFSADEAARRPMKTKKKPAHSLEAKESFRRIVKELMTKASQMMENPTPRMKMERRILSAQWGLRWFSGIMTFGHLGLVVRAHEQATPFQWAKETYSLTGNFEMADDFVDGFLQFSADHVRPQIGCTLDEIEKYCHLLMNKFGDILHLSTRSCRRYIVPQMFRKYFLRLETLTQTASIDEYYSNIDKPNNIGMFDSRMAYWTTKTVAGIADLAPDSKGYMSRMKADMKLSSVAIQFGMHPLMVPCWASLIGKAVKDYGEAAATEFLQDTNQTAEAALTRHFKDYGDCLPPSIDVLMAESGFSKISNC